MVLLRISWAKLYRMRTGIGRFHLSIYKWGFALSSTCECGTTDQTADHVISAGLIHRAPQGMPRLSVLDDDT